MIERSVYAQICKIKDPTLRTLAESAARLVLENWLYALAVVFLWRFPYIIADLSDSEVMPRRPTGDSAFWQSEMGRAMTLACLAMSYNLLFGFNGIISFGHALFFGAGGYVTFILMFEYDTSFQQKALIAVIFVALGLAVFSKLSARVVLIVLMIGILLTLLLLPGEGSISFYQAAALAVLVSIALSLVSGIVTLRLRGIYFTMFTLALAEMFFVLAKSGTFRDITGAEDGLGFRNILPESLNPTPTFEGNRLEIYRYTVIFFVLVFLAIRRYLNSPVGRVIVAIRENENRARTIGYNTFYYKVLTMIFAGVLATLSGLLFVVWSIDKRVHPEALSLKFTVDPLLHTLIGGVGTLTGPVIAALGLNLGETYIRNETFMLTDKILGTVTIWHVIVALLVAMLLWVSRRRLRALANRLLSAIQRDEHRAQAFAKDTWNYRGLMIVFYGAVILGCLVVGLVIGQQVMSGSELETEVYMVSDLWDLFLGILFVIVVMVLPNGIVGTWNKLRIERRIRQMEKELQRQKETAS